MAIDLLYSVWVVDAVPVRSGADDGTCAKDVSNGPSRWGKNLSATLTIYVMELDVNMLKVISANLTKFPKPRNASLPGTWHFAKRVRC
jgi:hypothetical protein